MFVRFVVCLLDSRLVCMLFFFSCFLQSSSQLVCLIVCSFIYWFVSSFIWVSWLYVVMSASLVGSSRHKHMFKIFHPPCNNQQNQERIFSEISICCWSTVRVSRKLKSNIWIDSLLKSSCNNWNWLIWTTISFKHLILKFVWMALVDIIILDTGMYWIPFCRIPYIPHEILNSPNSMISNKYMKSNQ